MDSDSDSDCSHISSTPPRNPTLNLIPNSIFTINPKPVSHQSSIPIKIHPKPTSDLSSKPITSDQNPISSQSSTPVKFDLKPISDRPSKRLNSDSKAISDISSKPIKSDQKPISCRPSKCLKFDSKPVKSDKKPISDQHSKSLNFDLNPVKTGPKPTSDRPSKTLNFDQKPVSSRPSERIKTGSKPENIEPVQVLPDPPIASHLPFQILRKLWKNDDFNTESSVNVSAGGHCSSKFASFSKIQRPNLVLEPIEDELKDIKGTESRERVVKRHPNLIGGSVFQAVPVKRMIKNVNEGNFVRLNINGYGNKSKFKGKSKYKSSSTRIKFRGGKRKFGEYGEGSEKNDNLDEDRAIPNKELRSEEEEALIEEAVLGVQNELSDDNLLKLLKVIHGYESFREGQLEAIKMVLLGKSTMLVLPTGAGKSLCYQLSAMVLPGITLVVSPLVALMIDQLRQLPPMIPGGLLSSTQTLEEKLETMRLLQEGCIKVLFVSPERFLNEEFLSIFSTTVVSLLVVDEAHCVSEWSHNFRPSYMRLRASLLRSRLNVKCILAMTATATTKTLSNVMCALEIPSENLVKTAQWRENLQLSVSVSRQRKNDLIALLKSPPYAEIKSIIIYCKFQSETDSLSKYMRDNDISARSYHSGIPPKDRNNVQKQFCSGKIKAVVATVAFGMGLDKRDVGASKTIVFGVKHLFKPTALAMPGGYNWIKEEIGPHLEKNVLTSKQYVIHYSLPESLEEYVQEIGRAGRDGRLSYCHLLFDDTTYFFLRSLAYSDGVDEFAVSRFLSHVFTTDLDSRGKICSFAQESASRNFDMREEVMLTILTQLELGEVQYLQILPQINVTCTLNFHQTTPTLLAAKDLVIAAVLEKSDTKHGQYVFDVPTVANSIGVSALDTVNQLQNLKAKGEISFEMKDPAYCYTIIDVPKDFCSLAAHITKWLSEVESCKVQKLDAMFSAAAFAVQECKKVNGCKDSLHTPCLQKKILDYFGGNDDINIPNKIEQSSRFLRADIKVFLQSNSQAKFTPRSVARIMHGIASPAFPSRTWSTTHFWGRYMSVDFKAVMEAAKAELMSSNKTDRI